MIFIKKGFQTAQLANNRFYICL